MSAVLRLCETESQALSTNLGPLLSPEVSKTLMWFLRRFCLSYLLPNESFYSEVSFLIKIYIGSCGFIPPFSFKLKILLINKNLLIIFVYMYR